MKVRKITVGDVQAVTEYSRDQVRGLLDQIYSIFGAPLEQTGNTRIFSAHEFLVIVLCAELETVYGLKRKTVGSFAPEIAKALAKPRSVAQDSKLVLNFENQQVQYLDETDMVSHGLVLPLSDVFRRVDGYLLPHRSKSSQFQQDLNLGPSLMADANASGLALKAAGGRE